MFEDTQVKEINRAILVGLNAPSLTREENATEESMEELSDLLKTAGGECVGTVLQQKDAPDPRTFIGEGKVAEVRELVRAMEHAAANIRDYNEKLLTRTMEWTSPDGGRVGRIVRGLTRVGIYVPGGTAAYPSSVLMNAVPAKVAGVGEIVMVTPPTENLNDAVLAAAKIAGVDRVIAVGGAQAVAALTYGAGFIPRVDKLVGPGNAYVAAAKRMAYGQLDIDMVAGPSEVLVIADQTANPCHMAADLLSQAEHDKMASAVLVTDSMKLAEQLAKRVTDLMRELGIKSLKDSGFTLEDCLASTEQFFHDGAFGNSPGTPGEKEIQEYITYTYHAY